MVSVSNHQRLPLPRANWQATVYHGLPVHPRTPANPDWNGIYAPRSISLPRLVREPYLAWVGRVSAEKRLDRAIDIARRAGMELKIAAKIDPADLSYFEREIAHRLDDPLVDYLGELGEIERTDLVAEALALLFPIDWPEPFGMVMIEAMAVGTPVVAWENGSVPEVIDEGVTGFIVHSIEEAAEAVRRASRLDRRRVRRVFERRFSASRMTDLYEAVYQRVREKQNRSLVKLGAPG